MFPPFKEILEKPPCYVRLFDSTREREIITLISNITQLASLGSLVPSYSGVADKQV